MSFRTDDFPRPTSQARQSALSRLRSAMEWERVRRRRGRARRRSVVGIGALLLVLGVSPAGPNQDLQPLLGLADAVAASLPPLEPVGRHWYTRSESTQLVSLETGLDRKQTIEFLVSAVEETWHDAGHGPMRTRTYGLPRFLSSEDEDAFFAAGLGKTYVAGKTVDIPISQERYAMIDRLVYSAPDQLSGALRRQVAGLGDRRLEEVQLLRLTADLIQLHADDPLVRSQILRVIADIPGIEVTSGPQIVTVSFDYVDGDRPLQLVYQFDAHTAHLVGESLAALATQSEPATIIRTARHTLLTGDRIAES